MGQCRGHRVLIRLATYAYSAGQFVRPAASPLSSWLRLSSQLPLSSRLRRAIARVGVLVLAAVLLPGTVQADAHAGSRRDDIVLSAGHHISSRSPASIGHLPTEMSTPSSRWQWPLDGQRDVIRSFEAPAHRYAAGHRGVDLAGEGAVRAVESGVVRFAGMVAGRGVVSITHHDGLVSTYEPVAASVTAGAVVHTGDTIGTLRSEAATAESTDSLLSLLKSL